MSTGEGREIREARSAGPLVVGRSLGFYSLQSKAFDGSLIREGHSVSSAENGLEKQEWNPKGQGSPGRNDSSFD